MSAVGRRRSRRLRPIGSAQVQHRRRVLGRAAADQPRAHHPARLRRSCSAPARWTTSGWRPAPTGAYRACADIGRRTSCPFLDSDVYKWLEAVGWELGRGADPGLARGGRRGDRRGGRGPAPRRLPQQLRPGGRRRARRTSDLAWGHEFYCVGHLIQAAVAWHRALGDDRLLDHRDPRRRPHRPGVRARRARRDRRAPRHRDGAGRARPGSPASERYLDARRPDARPARPRAARRRALRRRRTGRTTSRSGRPRTVAGHAVRQLYLDCGAVDVAVERGDEDLLAAVRRRWDDMVRTRTLPDRRHGQPAPRRGVRRPVRAAARPGVRRDLRGHRERHAGLAAAAGHRRARLRRRHRAGHLQRRAVRAVADRAPSSSTSTRCSGGPTAPYEPAGHGRRAPWYPCACCPPNLMRLLSSWQQYLATSDDTGDPDPPVRHRRTSEADIAGGAGAAVGPDRLPVARPGHRPRRPDARTSRGRCRCGCPGWCGSATLTGAGGRRSRCRRRRTCDRTAAWRPGDAVVLDLDLPVRVTEPDPRVDAVRGCVAVERGPLVYCVESADLPAGRRARGPALGPAPARPSRRPGRTSATAWSASPCRSTAGGSPATPSAARSRTSPGPTAASAACGCGSRADRPARRLSAGRRRRRGRVPDDQVRLEDLEARLARARPGRGPARPPGRRRG